MQSIIEVSCLEKSFRADFWKKPIQVLNGMNFTIDENQILGLIGANGSGKTTFLKILMGLISQDRGHIIFKKHKNINEFKKVTSFLPERPYFYSYLTGMEFILYQSKLHGLDRGQILSAKKRWAERLKIEHALDRKIKTYSKGMLQRLGFLSLLITDPDILIMDEPLSGLDPIGRKDFKDIIREVHSLGKTFFFSSHVLADIEEVCHKVLVLNDGKVQFQGALEEIYEKYPPEKYEIRIKEKLGALEDISLCSKLGNSYQYVIDNKRYAQAIEVISSTDSVINYFGPHNYNLESIIYNLKGV